MKAPSVHRLLPLALQLLALAAGGGMAFTNAEAQTEPFTLTSPDLTSGTFNTAFILNGLGCAGANVSPALEWRNVPMGTKSLALQVHDPDAPTGSGFWHWAVYNIPATASGLGQGAGNSPAMLPAPAFGGTTDFMDTGVTGANGNYGGPCPPIGDKAHRYVFTLYALGVDDLQKAGAIPRTGTPALYAFILNKGLGSRLLGKTTFTATYAR